MPLLGVLAEISAGDIGALLLDRVEPLKIEGDRRISVATGVDQLTGKGAGGARLAQTIKDPAPFAEPVEQASLAQQLQMSRNARLALSKNLGQFADGEFAASA